MARRRDRGKRARMLNSMVSFLLQPLPGGEPVAVAAALAELAEPLWGVTLVIMWSVDEVSGQLQLAGVSGADRNRVEEVLRADEPFVKELMDGGKPVVVKDLSRETGWGNRELLDITAHEALLGAPIVVDGRTVGVFVLLSSNPDRFTPWDEPVLEIFARHLPNGGQSGWVPSGISEHERDSRLGRPAADPRSTGGSGIAELGLAATSEFVGKQCVPSGAAIAQGRTRHSCPGNADDQ